MMEGLLSQDEIDALLGGGSSDSDDMSSSGDEGEKTILTKEEIDAIGEIGNISLGSSSTALSTLLSKEVSINTPKVEVYTFDEFKLKTSNADKALVQIEYRQGITGLNLLLLDKADALVIADLMMGNDGTNPPDDLNDIYLSAVGEAMNQMMGSSSTSLAGMFKKEIDILPPVVSLSTLDEIREKTAFFQQNKEFIAVSFDMEVEDLIKTNIYQIMEVSFGQELTKELYSMSTMVEEKKPEKKPEPKPQVKEQQTYNNPQMQQPMYAQGNQQQDFNQGYNPQMQQQAMYQQPMYQQQQQPMYQQPMYQQPYPPQGQVYGGYQGVNVQPVQFTSFGNGMQQDLPSNIGIIMDVPLNITVELGRTKMKIKEILDLGPGSIVELDKLAGEPVDILVNGKLMAKGEVVVIDESFGVRITDIISQMERMNNVQ